MRCGVCTSQMLRAFSLTILNRYDVDYHECAECGFLRTDEPYWLEQAYSSAISRLDTGAVARNLACAAELAVMLPVGRGGEGPFLDFAGGHGLLTRLMRDAGFDFYWHDAYATNDYATGFDWDDSMRPARTVTAVEVLEHTVDPGGLLETILELSRSRTVLFTTELRPADHGQDWWYLVPETGQHVGFHTEKSLRLLAAGQGLGYWNLGRWHLLSDRRPVRRVPRGRLSQGVAVLRYFVRARSGLSRTWPDHQLLLSKLRQGEGHVQWSPVSRRNPS